MPIRGKVAIITGSTSDIGRATAERFLGEGANVIFTGRSTDAGETIVNGLGSRPINRIPKAALM